jgi:hypothetical protein
MFYLFILTILKRFYLHARLRIANATRLMEDMHDAVHKMLAYFGHDYAELESIWMSLSKFISQFIV